MNRITTGIFWFTNDLRLHDNPALLRASSMVDELVCVYVIDRHWRVSSQYSQADYSHNADRFLDESLQDLDQSLQKLGQRLIVQEAETVTTLKALVDRFGATKLVWSAHVGIYENQAWDELQKVCDGVDFRTVESHTLFEEGDLPFCINELPESFTKFKNAIGDIKPCKPIAKLNYLPKPPALDSSSFADFASPDSASPKPAISSSAKHLRSFIGGETAGLSQLKDYFGSEKPMFYKEVRNAIDGWDNSCKFSPWLANGSLSVRQAAATLFEYEENITANESTYWIYFELLWREYFQWYARKNGSRLFSFFGIRRLRPLTSYYPERFQKWVAGATPYPLVNACMNELKATGYLSNRGRQIVASCFVNELAIDWRYGAAYFEQALIDYDVAANWGNWQYLAGVGADQRSKRHFNLEKQTQQFDPDGRYIDLWGGAKNSGPLDSMDAADWPIS